MGGGGSDGEAGSTDIGNFSRSLPASIRNISKVFKQSPFQKPVGKDSFIIENPKIYYINKSENLNQKPLENEAAEPLPEAHFESILEQGSSSLQYPNLVKPESLADPAVNINDTHLNTNEFLDVNHTDDISSHKLFNDTNTHHDTTFNDLQDLNGLNYDDFSNPETLLQDVISANSNPLTQSDSAQLFSIPITDDKQFNVSSFGINNMEMQPIDDFESDVAAFERSEFYSQRDISYSNLIQTPLRDSISNSIHSSPSTQDSLGDYTEADIITIPRTLEHWPDMLLNVPMYKDLFHHFVYITADILVPAPSIYPQNPFKTILPSMALSTPHLLALLLAFSATHRARFLRTEDPKEVVSRLLTRAFQGFIKCLESQQDAKSDTTLATAILLSSYDILISAGNRSWKTHMHGARDIVVARDFAQSLLDEQQRIFSYNFSRTRESPKTPEDNASSLSPSISPRTRFSITDNEKGLIGPRPLGVLRSDIDETNVSFFLIRWFAYIDVIGSLSSAKATAFLTTNEDMAQLWGLHDWHLSRIQKRSLTEIYQARASKLSGSNIPNSFKVASSLQGLVPENTNSSYYEALGNSNPPSDSPSGSSPGPDLLNIGARHYGIKVDFLLGVDLDVLPVFSKISFFVRQRRRLTESLRKFLDSNPHVTMDDVHNETESSMRQRLERSVYDWLWEWKKADNDLIKEALELSKILMSLCEAYELRRKNYISNALGLLKKKRRDSNPSQRSSPDQSQDQNSPTKAYNNVMQGIDQVIFSEESCEKLNTLLKASESMVPAISQLPASVQAHSQLSILNTLFCYSAIIHIYRRVMNLPSESPMVQKIVKHNINVLDTYIPIGSAVECCMSFPTFTLGCEVLESNPEDRQKFWLRLQGMERFGIDQATKAREMMELCWKERRSWTDIMEEKGWDVALV